VCGQTLIPFTSSGTWTCPAGVTSIKVEVYGAGGGGGGAANTNNYRGAGGGGGAYNVNNSVSVVPGTTYNIIVGNGGSAGTTTANGGDGGNTSLTNSSTILIIANGGKGGGSQMSSTSPVGGAGGAGGTFSGGSGFGGASGAGGGGGGCAGTSANGVNANSTAGGAAGNGGAIAGKGGNATGCGGGNQSNPCPGINYGGGGGGTGKKGANGTSGAGGYCVITYTCPSFAVSAGSDQTLTACSTTTTLSGSAIPSGMTGTWTVVSGTANIVSPNSPNSEINGLLLPATNGGTTTVTLRWTISNGICGTTFDDVVITTSRGGSCSIYTIPSSGTSTVSACGGSLYDSGGQSGSYVVNSSGSITINPVSAGSFVQVSGTVTAEGGYDYLTIYDGSTTAGSILWGGSAHGTGTSCQTFTVPLTTSTTGSLTINFTSDASNVCTGVDLTLSCFTPSACSGTPDAGSLTSTNLLPCATGSSTNFTLSSDVTQLNSGITYQWQRSTDNITFTDISGATSATYTSSNTSLSNAAYYRLVVNCTNSQLSSTSASIFIGYNATCYCNSSSTNVNLANGYISNVSYDAFSNSSLQNNYANYTSLNIGSVVPGNSFSLNVQVTNPAGAGTLNEVVYVYVDWNNNGILNDPGEMTGPISLGTSPNPFLSTINVSVPITATTGLTRMRIRLGANNLGGSNVNITSNPCLNFTVGEVEDYAVTICPVATITSQPAAATICANSSTSFSVSATAASGTGSLSYQWQVNTGSSWSNVTNGVNYSNATTATLSLTSVPVTFNNYQYRVLVTNACGTTVTSDAVTLTVNALPVVNAGTAFTKTCVANTSGATIGETAEAGHTYSWSPSTGLSSATASNPTANPTATTTYTVTKTNTASGCTATGTVTVTVNNSAISVNAGTAFTKTCVANTSGAAIGETAEAGHTYSWSPSTGLSSATASNPTANPTATTTYTVTKTNTASGCTATGTVTVTVDNQAPTVSVSANQAICAGSSATITASGATSYVWDNSLGTASSVTVSPGTSTTYQVTGTAANGCTNTDQVVVTVNALPTVNAGADQTVCAGTSVTLSGSGANTYSWNNSVTNGTAFTPASTNTYTVTGTNTTTGCTNTDQVVVTVNALPTVNAGADQTVCAGTSVTLSGSGANTYSWNNSVINGTAFMPASTNTYTVTGTNTTTGCTNSDQVVVTVNALPTVNAGVDQTVCAGTSVTLSGSGANTYSWNNSVTNGTAFTPASTNTYTVTGTNTTTGCTNSDQVVVTVNALPLVNANASLTSPCLGQSVTLTGGGATTYSWSNGVTGASQTVTPTETTTYTLTGTANGCSGTAQVTVALPTVSTSLSVVNSSATCVVNQNGWVHFLDDNGRLVASINSQEVNLGTVTATSYLDAAPQTVDACGFPGNTLYATTVLGRHWKISVENQPAPGQQVLVRLPFTVATAQGQSSELGALSFFAGENGNPNDNVLSITDLGVTKYSGTNEDGNFANNCGNGTFTWLPQVANGNGLVSSMVQGHPANHQYITVSTNSFSEFWVHGSATNSPLPVELIAFTSECNNEDVAVKWSTASEFNSQHYVLQFSEDGYSWSDLYVSEAAGFSTSLIEYAYMHNNAARTKNYYRLRQYDNDGTVETYSPIMSNCSSDESVFMTFPNPSADAFTVVVNDKLLSGSNVLNISDASGKLIYSIAVELENGSGSFALEGLDLPAGLYYLQLNNGSHTSRVIKHSFR